MCLTLVPALIIMAIIVVITGNDQFDIFAQIRPAPKRHSRACTQVAVTYLVPIKESASSCLLFQCHLLALSLTGRFEADKCH